MSKYINNLIKEGEHQQLDFKFEVSDSKKIARSLVAFANTDGGRLLLGVKDNGKIAGIRTDEEVYMIESAAELYCNPPVRYELKPWTVDGKSVLEVIVPKSTEMPHYVKGKNGKWWAYIRVKDQNLLANKILLEVWKRKKQDTGILVRYKNQEKLLLKYLEEHPYITFSTFRKLGKINYHQAEKILVNLISIGVLEIELTEKSAYYKLKKPSIR